MLNCTTKGFIAHLQNNVQDKGQKFPALVRLLASWAVSATLENLVISILDPQKEVWVSKRFE